MSEYIVSSEALEWLEEDSDTFFTEYDLPRIILSDDEEYKNKHELSFDDKGAYVELTEIIRCHQCKHQEPDAIYGGEDDVEFFKCDVTATAYSYDDQDHFCSFGERKNG